MRSLWLSGAVALVLAACGQAKEGAAGAEAMQFVSDAPETVQTPVQKPVLGSFGFDMASKDPNVDPGDDFYRYANGTWLDTTEIPGDRSRYGAFGVLADRAELRVREIIEEAASAETPTTDQKSIGDYFAAYMNQERIEELGLAPLEDELARIQAAEIHEDIARLMADPELGLDAPVAPFVYIDFKDNENYVTYLSQSGLGLPNRDYYFDEDEKSEEIRAAYVDYLEFLLEEAGEAAPREAAEAVMAFETALAEGHWDRVKQRQRELLYNKTDREGLKDYAPGLPWDLMLETAGLGEVETLILRENDAIQNAAAVFADTDVATLKAYLTKSLLDNHSAFLPSAIDEASFEFYGRTLRGQEEQRARWKRGVSVVNGTLGELVGKVYVSRHFPESSKAQMDALVENLRASFRDGLDGLDWMGEDTKAEAQSKLAKFNPKIGYPDRWETYEGLEIDRDDLIGTVQSARSWDWNDQIGQLGQPIDRDEWGMTPQTVNAYYNSALNEIVFPAAILDAPFFDPAADPAINYGGIGAVIGHEMGHGFDDQGRKSDGDGVQRDWWTPEDAQAYEARAGALADQYSEFSPLPDAFVDGRLSLGENIGDLTGVTMAYDAYKRSLGGEEAPMIDGLTGDQRFFLGWAQIWQNLYTDEALRAQLKNGPHSPPRYRVNGIVRNFDPWYEAFDVSEDDAMYLPPEQRVKIW